MLFPFAHSSCFFKKGYEGDGRPQRPLAPCSGSRSSSRGQDRLKSSCARENSPYLNSPLVVEPSKSKILKIIMPCVLLWGNPIYLVFCMVIPLLEECMMILRTIFGPSRGNSLFDLAQTMLRSILVTPPTMLTNS